MRRAAALFLFFSAACAPAKVPASRAGGDLDPRSAQALILERAGDPGFQVLDVRTPEEFASGHIAGARNLDYRAPGFSQGLLDLDRGKSYLVHCAAGGRSSKAVEALRAMGFSGIYHMPAGINGWRAEGLPVSAP